MDNFNKIQDAVFTAVQNKCFDDARILLDLMEKECVADDVIIELDESMMLDDDEVEVDLSVEF